MNPFLGLDCRELCDARLALVDVARKGDLRERNAFEALFDAVEAAGDVLPMPERVGTVWAESVDPLPTDPADRFEVSIMETPTGSRGIEWGGALAVFRLEPRQEEPQAELVEVLWTHDAFGPLASAPCSLVDDAYRHALDVAQGLADEAAREWAEKIDEESGDAD